MERLDVRIRPVERQSCRVRVGADALDLLVSDFAGRHAERRLALVTDSNVLGLHAGALAERLSRVVRHVEVVTIPAGESHKSRETKVAVEDRLLSAAIGREDLLLAVGGGVVGDLAGFVASTWHRGIEWVQAPTTLLAMVDASLGGKTGVNVSRAKNLVGSFHHPSAVFADVRTLATLSEREYLDGFAEVVKAAVVADREFFEMLETSCDGLRRRDPFLLEQAVLRSIRIKLAIVEQDARELGRRVALNFGHTVAHAIELQPGSSWSHGQAVAFGMAVEAELACALLGFPRDDLRRLRELLRRFDLPVTAPAIDASQVLATARLDKKNRDGRIRVAIPRRIGLMSERKDLTRRLEESALREVLESSTGAD